jgi:putative flavoprotein involved in K+ transport
MLQATLEKTRPSRWLLEGHATETDGITEAWFNFETLVSRGKGLLRLRDGKAWTLLTTMVELKGFEEAKGESRPKGVEHG